MLDYFIASLLVVILFAVELLYFRIAVAYKIIDKPNQRSSHTRFTIRGGGIIFPVAVLGWQLANDINYPWLLAGLLLITVVSFIDDLNHIHSKVRFLFQFVAVGFLLFQFSFDIDGFWYLIILTLGIGTMNAWNFMDGVNGITGGYSLVTIGSLFYVNHFLFPFTNNQLILFTGCSLLVFNYFNFRRKAQCFAGDVGSISIAFIIIFLLVQLVAKSHNLLFVGFILLYGLDTATTIFFRIMRRENIFEAHRSHFYQFLVNEQKWPHLVVASFYCLVQLAINAVLITQLDIRSDMVRSGKELMWLVAASGIAFLAVRFVLEGKQRLLRMGKL